MKKFLTVSMIIVLLCANCSILATAQLVKSPLQDNLTYDVNAPQMTESELYDYYHSNNIFITNPQPFENAIVNISSYLNTNFSEYNWSSPQTSDDIGYVSDVYRGNPEDISEYDSFMQTAKQNAGITYKYIGCGAIALCSQLFYLSEQAGYTLLNSQSVNYYDNASYMSDIEANRTAIATEALALSKGVSGGDLGTFVAPHLVINTAQSMLSEFYAQHIQIYGDLLPSTLSISQKRANLISSIDNGMPVIVWTTLLAGDDFGNHYFNVFGYEIWDGVDAQGNQISKTFFKANLNTDIVYIDSDVFDTLNCGFIFFQENYQREFYRPSDYNFPLAYNNSESTSNVGTANVTRLRTAYVDHYDSTNTTVDSKYISLSAKKQGAGRAFINYKYNKTIKLVNVELSLWGTKEGLSYTTGSIQIICRNANGDVTVLQNLLTSTSRPSTNPKYPTKVQCVFPQYIIEFEIVVVSNYPGGTYNRGRVVVESVDVVFF